MAGSAGAFDRGALEREVAEGGIDTVVTAFPDLYGRLVGKRIHAPYFVSEILDHGMHVCDYLVACDVEMDPTPGYAFASWSTGYGDLHATPDLATLRRAAWLERTAIVLLAVPFSMIGAVWCLYLLGYNLSVAVWVGIIALAGVDAETGVIMLLYLDQAFYKRRNEGRMLTNQDLQEAISEGAVKRIRPKMMTVMAILVGLLPIMWSHGAGADVMKRIAAPMIGGVLSSFLLELLVYPAIYEVWRGREIKARSNER